MENQRFEFQRYREFGDIISDSFTFLFRNIKPLAIGFLVFVVPVFLLGALVMIPVMDFILGETEDLSSLYPFVTSFASIFFVLATLLGSFVLYALVYAIVIAYQEHPDEELTIPIMWNYVPGFLGKILIVTLIIVLVIAISSVVLFGISALISPVLIFLIGLVYAPLLLYFLVRYIFSAFIYSSEETTLATSFSKSAFIIKDHWWWTFLVLIVVSLISTLVSYIFVLPATLYMGASSFLSADPDELLAAPSKSAMIFYGLSMIGSLFTSAYTVIGIILQYYSLKEKKEGTSLMDRIEQIGSDDSIGFDNEGEY